MLYIFLSNCCGHISDVMLWCEVYVYVLLLLLLFIPIPMVVLCQSSVWGHLIAGVAGLNLAASMKVRLLCLLCVV
jgi:hypothetical protein